MRTEGTSRPSVGLVAPRDDHLPVSIPGVMILNFEARSGDIAPKNMFSGSYSRLGNAIANRSRLTVAFFAVDPHAEFEALGPRLRLSQTIL